MPSTPDAPSPARVLVVEDDAILAMYVERIVETLGYTPLVCDRGEDAVVNARRFQPALVLMDVQLKGKMTGVEAAETIREEVGCPVIFMTAFNDGPNAKRMRQISGAGVLGKPIDEPRLRHLMRKRIEL